MSDEPPRRNYFSAVLGCYCPRCREGKLFKNNLTISTGKNMEMYDYCPVCGQRTDIEVGFYYGTGYISYALSLAITVLSFALWFLVIGFSYADNRFFWWIALNSLALLALQPFLMRLSRSLWISCFVSYDPLWPLHKPEEPERIIESEMNNW